MLEKKKVEETPKAVSPLPNDMLQDMENLRDRVDKLEIETAEKSKPWYKTFSGIGGLLALLFSVFSIIYTTSKDQSSELDSKRKETRENLNNILLLEKDIDEQTKGEDIDQFVGNHLPLVERFEILLDNIDNIEREIPLQQSTQAYLHIAYAYFHFSFRADRAFKYYDLALKVAKDAYDSANVYLGLFTAYYGNGIYYDLKKAREFFEKDIAQLKLASDNKGEFYICRDFAAAAYYECPIDETRSKSLLDSAKLYRELFKTKPGVYENLRRYINQKVTDIELNFGKKYDSLPMLNGKVVSYQKLVLKKKI